MRELPDCWHEEQRDAAPNCGECDDSGEVVVLDADGNLVGIKFCGCDFGKELAREQQETLSDHSA